MCVHVRTFGTISLAVPSKKLLLEERESEGGGREGKEGTGGRGGEER